MPYNLNSLDPNFENDFATVLSSKREDQADVTAAAEIIADVIRRGDDAVIALTAKFDHVEVKSMVDLSLSSDDLKAAYDRIDQDLRDALHLAADRIGAFMQSSSPKICIIKMALALGWVSGTRLLMQPGFMYRGARLWPIHHQF